MCASFLNTISSLLRFVCGLASKHSVLLFSKMAKRSSFDNFTPLRAGDALALPLPTFLFQVLN